MEYKNDAILKLSGHELYKKAMKFKKNNDRTNYHKYLTMAANYDYEKAKTECCDYEYLTCKGVNKTELTNLYNVTKEYIYSEYLLTYFVELDKDYKTAFKQYKIINEKGNPHAAARLGYFYEYGFGVSTNVAKAVELYELASKGNDSFAMASLAYLYYSGTKIPQDYAKAVHFYKLSAKFGNYDNYNTIGIIYYTSKGNVKQNYSKAHKYFKLAQKHGDGYGMYNIGICYENGHSLNQDNLKAIKYYKLAVQCGNDDCINLSFTGLCRVYSKINNLKEQEKEEIAKYFIENDKADKLKEIFKNISDFEINIFKEYGKLKKGTDTFKK